MFIEIRPIVQLGDQYRLNLAQTNPFSAVQYVSKDKTEGVLFAFRVHIPDFANVVKLPPVYLRGLEPDAFIPWKDSMNFAQAKPGWKPG